MESTPTLGSAPQGCQLSGAKHAASDEAVGPNAARRRPGSGRSPLGTAGPSSSVRPTGARDEESLRLVAVASLLCGDHAQAWRSYRQAKEAVTAPAGR